LGRQKGRFQGQFIIALRRTESGAKSAFALDRGQKAEGRGLKAEG
jgi:hypothetical protein